MRSRVRAADGLVWGGGAQVRKLSLSESLGWAEGTLKSRPRNRDGDAAIEVLSVSSLFCVFPIP